MIRTRRVAERFESIERELLEAGTAPRRMRVGCEAARGEAALQRLDLVVPREAVGRFDRRRTPNGSHSRREATYKKRPWFWSGRTWTLAAVWSAAPSRSASV